MTSVWIAVVVVSLICVVLRAAGPVFVRASFPRRAERWLQLAAPALLAGFVAVQTLSTQQRLVIDGRLAGLAVAALLIGLRRSPALVLVAAAAATAAVRFFA
jgi:Branched-chain amino acid transport protein (AzlD)